MFGRNLLRAVILVSCVFAVSGCYYMQAARGQLELMNKREPIDELIAANSTPDELTARLQLVLEARQFSIDELHLPDNDSYRSYANLERDYVVWNVFAAPEFSLQAKSWCFPVVGCVSYRGYFAEDDARRKAMQLRDEGFDVAVGGVAAYSTLGKFSDPVLNTMMHWDDTDLIAVMFHELAHQLLYIKDDSAFNESFATAVEEIGIERWLAARGQEREFENYRDKHELRKRLIRHIESAREELTEIYASSLGVEGMRASKSDHLSRLSQTLTGEFDRRGDETPGWVNENLNNARLASMSLYHGRLAEFRELFAQCDQDIPCFYERAKALSVET
jgi:predicted aminopeptidase